MKLYPYRSFNEAVNDQPKMIAQIMYNTLFLSEWIPLNVQEEQMISSKIFMNDDQLRDIRFNNSLIERYQVKRMPLWLRRTLGFILAAFVFASIAIWPEVKELSWLAGWALARMFLFAIAAIFLFLGIGWCFAEVKPKVKQTPDEGLPIDEYNN